MAKRLKSRPGEAPLRRRDRRGRGLRGPLAPPNVPLVRTRSQRFDDSVLDALTSLDPRWAEELAAVQVVVEEVPPEAEFAFGRVEPAARRRPARLVVYRRPIEARAMDPVEREALVLGVLVGLLAELLGRSSDDIDPTAIDPSAG